MELNTGSLGEVFVAVLDAQTKSYNFGLALKVPVRDLDAIRLQYANLADQLREVVKAWLRTATATHRTWQTIADALKSPIVGEPNLASVIETRYCRDTPRQLTNTTGTKPQETHQQELALINKKLRWRDCGKAPEAMYRGSVATDGTMAYFNGRESTTVHQYHSDSQQWSLLPDLPHYDSTLVMADNMLTSVGGYLTVPHKATNSLLSLRGEGRHRNWSLQFPTMPTKRSSTAVVYNGVALIVAGGKDEYHNPLTTVEVLVQGMDTQQWFTASSLPHPFSRATISICGENIYMLGGLDQTDPFGTYSVLTCTFPELLLSYQTQSLAGKPIWQAVADAPFKRSSCATICGWLVAVGGRDEANKDTAAVCAYDESTNSWQAMKAMAVPRYWALVASLNQNRMMVVGGSAKGRGLDTIEVLKVL